MTLELEDRDYAAIEIVAHQYHNWFPMVEYRDIEQELYLAFLSESEQIEEWRGEGKDGEKRLFWFLRNAASYFCHKEKAGMAGYHYDDLVFYTNAVFHMAMPYVFNDDFDGAPTLSEKGAKTTGSDPAVGGNLLATVMDIRRALGSAREADCELFRRAFRNGDELDYDRVAGELGITRDAARKRLERAFGRLRRILGGPRPHEDKLPLHRRKAISNAHARAIIHHQEKGD